MRRLKSSNCMGCYSSALVNKSVLEVPAAPVNQGTRLAAAHGKGSTP